MRLRAPNALELSYVQDMMAWLLFLEPPARILQLGLGAASLTKFCLHHCPNSNVTAVELSDTVIMAAHSWFKLPHQHSRLQMVCGDAGKYISGAAAQVKPNVLQVDLYDAAARGPVIDSTVFYHHAWRYLGGAIETPGIAVFNFFGSSNLQASLTKLKRAFKGRVITLMPCAEGNIVALAFTGPSLQVTAAQIQQRALAVAKRYKLPTSRWLAACNNPANQPHWLKL